MKNITFKTIAIQNFLSYGKEVKIDFNAGINIITGHNYDKEDGNGVGKCVHKSTKIDIQIVDPQVIKAFREFMMIK